MDKSNELESIRFSFESAVLHFLQGRSRQALTLFLFKCFTILTEESSPIHANSLLTIIPNTVLHIISLSLVFNDRISIQKLEPARSPCFYDKSKSLLYKHFPTSSIADTYYPIRNISDIQSILPWWLIILQPRTQPKKQNPCPSSK